MRVLTPQSKFSINGQSDFFKSFMDCKEAAETIKVDPCSDEMFAAALQFGHPVNNNTMAVPDWLRFDDDRQYFWFISQVLRFITAPSKRLQQKTDTAMARTHFEARQKSGPILGLHVRLGDACSAGGGDRYVLDGGCRKLDSYMKYVVRLARVCGYKSIYLATDSQEAIVATKKYPKFTWMYQPMDRSRYDIFKGNDLQIEQMLFGKSDFNSDPYKSNDNKFDARQEFDEYMIDVYMLAKADGFVGSFTSNLGLLVYPLMTASCSFCSTNTAQW
jgi:hypothetical protein